MPRPGPPPHNRLTARGRRNRRVERLRTLAKQTRAKQPPKAVLPPSSPVHPRLAGHPRQAAHPPPRALPRQMTLSLAPTHRSPSQSPQPSSLRFQRPFRARQPRLSLVTPACPTTPRRTLPCPILLQALQRALPGAFLRAPHPELEPERRALQQQARRAA